MDTLTHALSGALLACATVPAERHKGSLSLRQRMAAGFAAAAFPDCDFGLRLIDTLTYLNLHRGFTHSVVMLPVWSLGLSLLFAAFTRGQVHWRAFYGVALLGIGIHIVQDLITSYGTMVFSPFSNWKPAIPLAFILDPYFTAIVVTGLLASALWAPRRHPAVIALAALAGYVALQAVLHQQATRIGEAYAAVRGFTDSEVQALPQPLSPFNWKIIVSSADAHHEAFVNLARAEERPSDSQKWLLARIDAGYQPPSAATWIRWPRVGATPGEPALAREAWNEDTLADFRRFAEIPALYRIDTKGADECVWFVDLRFTLPGVAPSFVYGVCRAGTSPWKLKRMKGQFLID
jgi:inner membrane protein